MKTVVNKPQSEYVLTGWLPTPNLIYIDASINGIVNNTVMCYQATGLTNQILYNPQKKRLSLLRGKMNKQNEKEIDEQILDLRKGWSRNI
jgi:hypothetical protein